MKLIILTILISIILTSCQNEINAKFEISNGTENIIDSINIKSFDHHKTLNYLRLESGETKIYFFNMTELPKVDGDYLLSFKNNLTTKKKRFGYFTNGYPMEDLTKIVIEKDTVVINQIFDKY